MTEYTPEKVAELVAALKMNLTGEYGDVDSLMLEAADALAAVSAERDKAVATGERILAEALKVSAERDEQAEPTVQQIEDACTAFYEHATGLTSWARLVEYDAVLANRYREGMRRALCAALDKEGGDDE